jgi:predicted permease
VWKPIPVPEPERLALFSWVSGPRVIMNSSWGNWARTVAGGRASTSFSHPIFDTFRHQSPLFETVFAIKPIGRVTTMVGGEAELVKAQLVSGDFYRGVGISPVAGRPLGPDDDVRGGSETVATISDGFWSRRFGRNASAIGSTIRVNQVPVTIVGVNPSEFTSVDPGDRADLYMPLNTQPLVFPWRHSQTGSLLDNPDYFWVIVMGRLKPGVPRAEAEGALDVTLRQAIAATLPGRTDRDQPHFRLLPGSRGQDNLREQFATPLFVLGALVAMVLLIACANVANLLLGRAAARRRELSLRLALGAGRWRIARQLLTEGLALGAVGGALGLLLAYWTRDGIPNLLLPEWSSWDLHFNADFDVRVLLLSTALTIATTVCASLAPIWQSLRVEIGAALKDGSRAALGAAAPLRGRSLVVFQVCLSVLMLVGAGLFVRTLLNLRSVALGFNPERIVLFTIDPPRARYVSHARKALFERLDAAMGAIPGVESASLSDSPLLSGGASKTSFDVNGRPRGPNDNGWVMDVGSRFFETMGIPIVAGRGFNERERETSPPVVVVNQRFVREFFPNEAPIGKTLKNNNIVYTIVGICGDVPYGKVREPVPPTFYRHFTQTGEPGQMTFEVRTAGTETATMAAVRAAARAIDKDLPIADVRTQTEQIDAMLSRERLFVALTSAFGIVAVILASIGIYGLMAHGVARRTNEIGVRLALGAERRDILLMILREASSLAALGAVIGVVGAAILSRYVRAMLFGIAPADPVTSVAAAVAMIVVALLAGGIPARKAARLDPMTALRHE